MENTEVENKEPEKREIKPDSKIREEYLERLNKDVTTAEIRKENLESQIHSLQIRLDGDRKLAEQEKSVKFSEERKKLAKMESDYYSRNQQIELKEVHLKDREKTVDSKERNYCEFLEDKKVFNRNKLLFQEYKTKIEKELKEKEGVIADIDSRWELLESERQVLDALGKTLTDREDDLDIQAGLLEQNKKEFEIYKQSEIEKYSNKEVVNA